MVTIVINPSADLPDVMTLRDELHDAICSPSHGEVVQVELSANEPPRHLVVQLLASAVATCRSSDKKVVFGPLAAAVVEKFEFEEGGAV